MSNPPIYLDYHATTPLDRRVREVMIKTYDAGPANPHSTTHAAGLAAHEVVEQARIHVAQLIGASAHEIFFTSGASEANNLAILGAAHLQQSGRIVASAIEHPSVLAPVRALAANEGFGLDIVAPTPKGIVELGRIKDYLSLNTVLVSVMAANNEIGTLQPVNEIAALAHEQEALFHCDATQAVGRVPIDVNAIGADLLSLSAHKIYGPMGIGALYIRAGTEIEPIMYGGAQEAGIRPGSVPAPLVVGFGEACRLALEEGLIEQGRIMVLRDQLLEGLRRDISGIQINGSLEDRLAGNLNVSLPRVNAEEVLRLCPNIAVAIGAACASATQKPSHVLKSLGLEADQINGAIRFGLGRFTTQDEIEQVVAAISSAYRSLV